MISDLGFPRLAPDNHRITSPPTPRYNCIAWSAGDVERWWQPGIFWPVESATEDYDVEALEEAFQSLGYFRTDDESLESGFEKVAIYGSGAFYTHASRQLPDGRWTSKLGRSEDIEHDSPGNLAGGIYGEVVRFMKRAVLPVETP